MNLIEAFNGITFGSPSEIGSFKFKYIGVVQVFKSFGYDCAAVSNRTLDHNTLISVF